MDDDNPTFKYGDIVTCIWGDAHSLTEGKQYRVIRYTSSEEEPGISFKWPAYVTVSACDTSGKPGTFYAKRFVLYRSVARYVKKVSRNRGYNKVRSLRIRKGVRNGRCVRAVGPRI